MLEHGGRLRRAAHEHGIPLADWLDLSTGISPWSWLSESGFVPSPASWLRLPEDDDGLAVAAADYFGAEALPVAGSQAAIQALPTLRAACRVGVLAPSYNEHAETWRRAGHSVLALAATAIDAQIESLDVLLLCNPNNPDGQVLRLINCWTGTHGWRHAMAGWWWTKRSLTPRPRPAWRASVTGPG